MTNTTFVNLIELMDLFAQGDKNCDLLNELGWPRARSPTCAPGSKGVSEIPDRNQWHCLGCRYQFSVTSSTNMHDPLLPLRKRPIGIYLMLESKDTISVNLVKRTLGLGSYRTAWSQYHRIREAMGNDPFKDPTLLGIIDIDETLIGGKRKSVGYSYRKSEY